MIRSDNPYQDDLDDIRFGYEDEASDCDHEEYDVDFEGIARCHCGHSWWLTNLELEQHAKWEAEYAEYLEREFRRDNRFDRRILAWLKRIIQKRKKGIADELPF